MKNKKSLQIVERKRFNSMGEPETIYHVWLDDEVIATKETIEEAEAVFDKIVNSQLEPSRTIVRHTYVNI